VGFVSGSRLVGRDDKKGGRDDSKPAIRESGANLQMGSFGGVEDRDCHVGLRPPRNDNVSGSRLGGRDDKKGGRDDKKVAGMTANPRIENRWLCTTLSHKLYRLMTTFTIAGPVVPYFLTCEVIVFFGTKQLFNRYFKMGYMVYLRR